MRGRRVSKKRAPLDAPHSIKDACSDSTLSTASKCNEVMTGLSGTSPRHAGRVENGRGCSRLLGRRGPVSRPRSSKRTCGFPASGSRTGLLPQAVAGGRPRCIRRRPATPGLAGLAAPPSAPLLPDATARAPSTSTVPRSCSTQKPPNTNGHPCLKRFESREPSTAIYCSA